MNSSNDYELRQRFVSPLKITTKPYVEPPAESEFIGSIGDKFEFNDLIVTQVKTYTHQQRIKFIQETTNNIIIANCELDRYNWKVGQDGVKLQGVISEHKEAKTGLKVTIINKIQVLYDEDQNYK